MELRVDHVDFGYGGDALTLHDISFTLDRPGLTCIIGPNGVGKSTLIRCINRLLKPVSGTVTVDGRDVQTMSLKELSEFMGYVPANSRDCFSMPVVENIMMGCRQRSRWRTDKEDLKDAYRIMRLLDLEGLAMRGSNELSAGQHQRVSLARGIVSYPKILILDEPTSNLDVQQQVYVTELLRALAMDMGMIVLMISHDLNISAKYADTIIVMSKPGVVYGIGSPEEVITRETIRSVYGVDCTIIDDHGRPHVVLGFTIPNDERDSGSACLVSDA